MPSHGIDDQRQQYSDIHIYYTFILDANRVTYKNMIVDALNVFERVIKELTCRHSTNMYTLHKSKGHYQLSNTEVTSLV